MLAYRDLDHSINYNFAFGYQEPYDNSQKSWLVRRPLRTASLKVHKEFDKSGLGLELIHNGDRRDKTSSSTYGTLTPYTLINLVGDSKINEKITVFSRIQNLANLRYESSYGFYDEGLNIQAGAEFNF